MAKVTLGPVIGKVTDRTARIGVEVDRAVRVTCVATPGNGPPVRRSEDVSKDRFTVFALDGLVPGNAYRVTIEGARSDLDGSFRTFESAPRRMNLAAVSCNFTTMREDTDLWTDLRDRNVGPGNVDLLLHAGDQVYGDNAFQEAEIILGSRTTGTAAQQRRILELYRRLYRMTWRHPATREVLANVPSLMIWDDHEIRDDWGSRKGDSDPSSAAYHIGTLAHRAFREYQRQLWQDEADWPGPRFEDHIHTWGPVGVLFVDQRGGRSFERDVQRPYLGVPQWERVTAALGAGGALDQVRALIVVTSVPLVYLGDTLTTVGAGIPWTDDLADHWAYGSHRAEQVQMLRALRYWKTRPGRPMRELLVVGGDVHIGCETDIRHGGETIFKQLITSPITNKPPGWIEFLGLKGLLEVEENLTDSYSFEHSRYTRRRNYGLILVRVPEEADRGPKVSGGLEIA